MFYKILLLVLHSFIISKADIDTSEVDKTIDPNDIAEALVSIICVDEENNTRINELKDKLNKINNYVVNKDIYSQILTNTTKETDLNETNFYKALIEEDHFKFLTENDPKSLYLKLKEKMNRDDILKILADKAEDSNIKASARKMMGEDHLDDLDDNDGVNMVVDKLIAEVPNDNHKYDFKRNASMYWDPQGELEHLKEYHQHDGRRIFKGERTTIRYYPFMVSVHVMGRFWCGGSIYWHDLVLTSASCLQLMHNNRFYRENPKNLAVRVGSNHSRIGGELVDALEVYFHPSYNPRTLSNNIAVIRLRYHLRFNYHRIPKIIPISHNPYGLPATAEILLLGWGVTKISQKLAYEPIFLQRKFLPVYPNTFCKEVYGDKFITSTMFCAGTLTTGEGACDHDAGGPVILAGRLVGIISFGPAVCGYPNAPTVFTLVGAYADWIETINETMPGYYRGRKRTTTTTRRPLFDYLATYRISC
ncbi:prostasin-like, partial [Achroia grisella]|uniref:prostasin-like n=1 Tax=Achroia grisella TaxID=688607 RepID=UPI0027D30FF9